MLQALRWYSQGTGISGIEFGEQTRPACFMTRPRGMASLHHEKSILPQNTQFHPEKPLQKILTKRSEELR